MSNQYAAQRRLTKQEEFELEIELSGLRAPEGHRGMVRGRDLDPVAEQRKRLRLGRRLLTTWHHLAARRDDLDEHVELAALTAAYVAGLGRGRTGDGLLERVWQSNLTSVERFGIEYVDYVWTEREATSVRELAHAWTCGELQRARQWAHDLPPLIDAMYALTPHLPW